MSESNMSFAPADELTERVSAGFDELVREIARLKAVNEQQRVSAQELVSLLRASEEERASLSDDIETKSADVARLQEETTELRNEVTRQSSLVEDAVDVGKAALLRKQFLERRLDFAEKQLRALLDMMGTLLTKN